MGFITSRCCCDPLIMDWYGFIHQWPGPIGKFSRVSSMETVRFPSNGANIVGEWNVPFTERPLLNYPLASRAVTNGGEEICYLMTFQLGVLQMCLRRFSSTDKAHEWTSQQFQANSADRHYQTWTMSAGASGCVIHPPYPLLAFQFPPAVNGRFPYQAIVWDNAGVAQQITMQLPSDNPTNGAHSFEFPRPFWSLRNYPMAAGIKYRVSITSYQPPSSVPARIGFDFDLKVIAGNTTASTGNVQVPEESVLYSESGNGVALSNTNVTDLTAQKNATYQWLAGAWRNFTPAVRAAHGAYPEIDYVPQLMEWYDTNGSEHAACVRLIHAPTHSEYVGSLPSTHTVSIGLACNGAIKHPYTIPSAIGSGEETFFRFRGFQAVPTSNGGETRFATVYANGPSGGQATSYRLMLLDGSCNELAGLDSDHVLPPVTNQGSPGVNAPRRARFCGASDRYLYVHGFYKNAASVTGSKFPTTGTTLERAPYFGNWAISYDRQTWNPCRRLVQRGGQFTVWREIGNAENFFTGRNHDSMLFAMQSDLPFGLFQFVPVYDSIKDSSLPFALPEGYID